MSDSIFRRRPMRYEERCARRKLEIDEAVQELVAVCSTLGDVSAVYAYGSYARNAVGPSSDLDALIVRRSQLPRSTRQDDIREKLRSTVGFDLLVVTPQEFEITMPNNSVGRSILAEALMLATFDAPSSTSGTDVA